MITQPPSTPPSAEPPQVFRRELLSLGLAPGVAATLMVGRRVRAWTDLSRFPRDEFRDLPGVRAKDVRAVEAEIDRRGLGAWA